LGNRKIRVSPAWYIVAFFWASSLIIAYLLYLNVVRKQKELFNYQQFTTSCVTGNNCRQIVDAIVMQSKSWTYSYTSTHGIRTANPEIVIRSQRYIIVVSLPDIGAQTVEIIPSTVSESIEFGAKNKNIYLPSENELTFAEDNFPIRTKIKVEIWNNKITLILKSSILRQRYTETGLLIASQSEDIKAQGINSEMDDFQNQILITTSNYPVFALDMAQKDFNSALVAMVFVNICVLLLAIRFRKA
jgi:hypothetical protein